MTDEIIGTYIGTTLDGHDAIRLTSFPPADWVDDSEVADLWDDSEDGYLWGGGWTKTYPVKRQQKAKKFLKSWLTDQEYEDLQDNNLIIPSKIFPDRTYKIGASAIKLIEVYTSGILDHRLCAVAKDPRFENDDTVLAKILMLKTNEKQFLKIAEKHGIHLDNGFGAYLTGEDMNFISSALNTSDLTIAWNLVGEVSLRVGVGTTSSPIQPGQLLTTNERGEITPFRLRPRHHDNN